MNAQESVSDMRCGQNSRRWSYALARGTRPTSDRRRQCCGAGVSGRMGDGRGIRCAAVGETHGGVGRAPRDIHGIDRLDFAADLPDVGEAARIAFDDKLAWNKARIAKPDV